MSKCACLIVEGEGDASAVSALLRKVLYSKLSFEFKIAPKPKICM